MYTFEARDADGKQVAQGISEINKLMDMFQENENIVIIEMCNSTKRGYITSDPDCDNLPLVLFHDNTDPVCFS